MQQSPVSHLCRSAERVTHANDSLTALLGQMPTEDLPLSISLWIRHPVEIGLVLKYPSEGRMVITALHLSVSL
jgi:hypothetical protein